MFRLLIVDDEYYVRVGIKSAIDWSEIGVEVVGEAADGEEALEMALSSRPDIILTDVRMPFMDELTLMERFFLGRKCRNVVLLY
ncbi:MAG: response regulator [Lachnospiraceae bacterium]